MRSFLVAILFLMSGCSTFFSGQSPIPVQEKDRMVVNAAGIYLSQIPSIVTPINQKSVQIYVVAFDGTRNDRDQIDINSERQTIVARLDKQLEKEGYAGKYYSGPGINSGFDAAVCTSCIPKAKKALEDLKVFVKTQNNNPEQEIRVFVLGFSRGAAIARHFMNLVSDTWPSEDSLNTVRTYGLLFDTVATGKVDVMRLGLSPTTDYLVHFIARDEVRNEFFPVVQVEDFNFPVISTETTRESVRFLEISLPGAHSDIGASYIGGLGYAYDVLAEKVLNEFGLIKKSEWRVRDNVFDEGMHDSRGVFDVITLVKSVNIEPGQIRKTILKRSDTLTPEQANKMDTRLKELMASKYKAISAPTTTVWQNNLAPIDFVFQKTSTDLKTISLSSWIDPTTIKFEIINKLKTYSFGTRDPSGALKMSKIIITDKVWNEFPENRPFTFEITFLRTTKKSNFYFYVDSREVAILPVNE